MLIKDIKKISVFYDTGVVLLIYSVWFEGGMEVLFDWFGDFGKWNQDIK